MRKLLVGIFTACVVVGLVPSAQADGYVDTAARALSQSRPVFVAAGSESGLREDEMGALRDQIARGEVAIYIAVLPGAAAAEAGGADGLPRAIGERMGGHGVWAVVAGTSFRAGSSFQAGQGLNRGEAGQLATLALGTESPRRHGGDVGPMLLNFVERVQGAIRAHRSAPRAIIAPAAKQKSNSGHVALTFLMVFVGIAVLVGLVFILGGFVRARARRRQDQGAFEQRKRTAQARYASIADETLALEGQVGGNAKARGALTEATSAYNRAATVIDSAVVAADVDTANEDLVKAENAIADARAYLAGRDPVAERAAEEKERAKREQARAKEERRRAKEGEREERERQERAARVTPENYQPRERQSTTYNHYYGGGYYGGAYYGPGFYRDPFWDWVVLDAILDNHDHDHDGHDGGHGDDHVEYADVSSGSGGGDWASSDSSSGGFDLGGSGGSGDSGGGDWGGGDSGGSDFGGGDSGGGGDW